jgi:hypothetical protein
VPGLAQGNFIRIVNYRNWCLLLAMFTANDGRSNCFTHKMGIQKQVFQGRWNGRQGRKVMLDIDELGIGVQLPKMSCSGVLDDRFQAGVVKPRSAIGVCPLVVIVVVVLATADGDRSSIACSK